MVLLINQRKTVPVYQYRDAAVWIVQRAGGWSFRVAQSASPLYQLHKKEMGPSFHCVITLEGQRIRSYIEELCTGALRFHGYALVGIVHIERSSTQELCLKSVGILLYYVLLQARDTERELADQTNTNGCYVNRDRITRRTVVPDDVIYFGNMTLLMGKDSIFVPEQMADTRLSEISYCKTVIEERETGTATCLTPEPMQKLTAEIELSLARGIQKNLPVIFVLRPSITTELSSTTVGPFFFWPTAERKQDLPPVIPTLFISLNMALRTILWPLLSKHYERK